jgi:hypothetical protein
MDVSALGSTQAASSSASRPKGPQAAGEPFRLPDLMSDPAAALASTAGAPDRLARANRELHFEIEAGRVKIEVRDLEGNVLRRIPVNEAIEMALESNPAR